MTAWTTPVLAVAAKDLRLLARDRSAFVFTFMFPVALGMFFGFMFGSGGGGPSGDLELAVYDAGGGAEGSPSRRFLAALTAPGEGLVGSWCRTRRPARRACAAATRWPA